MAEGKAESGRGGGSENAGLEGGRVLPKDDWRDNGPRGFGVFGGEPVLEAEVLEFSSLKAMGGGFLPLSTLTGPMGMGATNAGAKRDARC